jgi:hypothetical protein
MDSSEDVVEKDVEEKEADEVEEGFQLPEISAEDIIGEVLQLLGRLEGERQRLQLRLGAETTLIRSLQQEIDALMVQRMKVGNGSRVMVGRQLGFYLDPIPLYSIPFAWHLTLPAWPTGWPGGSHP